MLSQVRFNRVPAWVLSQVRFNRVPENVPKVPEKVWEAFGAEPGQVQQGFGEGLECFGAKPGQVQQVSGEGSRECRVRSGSAGFRRC